MITMIGSDIDLGWKSTVALCSINSRDWLELRTALAFPATQVFLAKSNCPQHIGNFDQSGIEPSHASHRKLGVLC